MPKHISRLLLLLVVFGAVALSAKSFFTKDSFYRYGHYRADSVPQIAGMAPSFQTPRGCQSCHGLRHAEWKSQAHKTVICEVCHGAAPDHPGATKVSIPSDTNRLCTQCHEKMPGRPESSVRQITAAHPASTQCISCHNPHAPRIEAAAGESVAAVKAGHDASATCAGCHGEGGTSVNPDWPNLAGQSATYIVRELASFHSGARRNDLMSPVAQGLADADIPQLAAYFSSQSCKASKVAAPAATLAAGQKVARSCIACHGDAGHGTSNRSLPRLAGQNASYLGSALAQFKADQRSDPIMAAIARDLSDADVASVSAYYAAQQCSTVAR